MWIANRRSGWLLGAAFLLGLSGGGPAETCRAAGVELLVPAYFYPKTRPGDDWHRLTAAAAKVSVTAILNPASGPGPRADPNYTRVVTAFRKAGGRVLGYVHTSYGKRPLAAVLADIDAYRAFYPLDGLFIDEMADADDAALYAYYASVYAHVKKANAGLRVVGNPGATTTTQGAYFAHKTADALVIFEGTYTHYPRFTPFPWTRDYPTSALGQIIDEVPSDQWKPVFARARVLRAGLLYVTDAKSVPNPYAGLPGYWDALVALAAAAD